MKGKLTRKIKGTSERPRLSVNRSLKHFSAQIIDDDKGITLVSASNVTGKKGKKVHNNVESAKKIGTEIAKKALEAGIKKVVFDRSGYVYQGRVAALAAAAREAGLDF
jgi:large subunit ribosomal protein L18